MAVKALPPLFALRTSRAALTAAIVLVVLAFGLAMGVYSSSGNAASGAVVSRLAQAAVDQVNSVASIFSGRSPGQRARGTLTNLKHKRSVALHERALPKIRPAPPASPLAAILAPPPVAPAVVPPPVAPLYSAVTKGPVGVPVAQSVPTIFPAMSPPPGGGFIVPPIIGQVTPPVSPTVTPPPPQAPVVPEPSSWMMMLVGFGLIGWMLRRAGGSGLILN